MTTNRPVADLRGVGIIIVIGSGRLVGERSIGPSEREFQVPAFSRGFDCGFDAEGCVAVAEPVAVGIGSLPPLKKRKRRRVAAVRGWLPVLVVGAGRGEVVPSRKVLVALRDVAALAVLNEYTLAANVLGDVGIEADDLRDLLALAVMDGEPSFWTPLIIDAVEHALN